MTLGKWTRFRRSLLGQMSALTIIFLLMVIGYFIVLPILQIPDFDPVERTVLTVRSEILLAVDEYEGRSLESVNETEIMRQALAGNPNLRYYVSEGEEVVQFGGPPRWRDAIEFEPPMKPMLLDSGDVEESTDEDEENPSSCDTYAYWNTTFDEDGVPAYVSYRDCDGVRRYIEVAGVDTAIPRFTGGLSRQNWRWIWLNSQQLLIASVGFVLIAILVILIATRSMRRVATVAEAFDADDSDHELPEEGLPTEVVPLIRAINEMNRKVKSAQEQQAFFLATAAHEMRTPMAILRTRLEELPENQTKGELRDDVRRITTLVEQLLRLMSIRNKSELPDEVDLTALAKKVVAERAPLSVEKGVDLELDANGSVVVRGDESLLNVALANLVDNAISFSGNGDKITVSVDDTRRVTVRDHGPGIPVNAQEEIFEPFAKNPPNRKGHGLGLAIAKAIVTLHGGGISAASASDGGAVFSLQF